ncbi:MAG: antitoxin VapB family protein [Candidatus Helarchaeales archaeon]
MVTKTITIKEEAYKALKNLKLNNESFSDTILRISKMYGNLKECWGTGTKTQNEYESELEEIEKRRNFFFRRRE